MIFLQSLKSVLRTPFRTLLFILLIAAVTAFACLGFGMLASGNGLLKAADKAYTTKAVIEYVDDGYPDASKYSDAMREELCQFDYSVLSDNENVLSFELQYEICGYIEGYSSKSRNNPYGKQGVLQFRYRGETEYGSACMIIEPYYKGDSRLKKDSIFYLEIDKESCGKGLELIDGHTYIAAGTFTKGVMNTDALLITPYENPGAPDEELFKLPVWDVTPQLDDDKYMDDERYVLFTRMVEAYNAMNNCISVRPTNDVSTVSPFIMQQTNLIDDGAGRYFTQDEYLSGARVIIMSEYVAKRMSKQVGDTISLHLYTGGSDGSFAKDSFWPDGAYVESGDYTIVGLFKENKSLNSTAYIPIPKDASDWLPEHPICYTVANVELKNGTAQEYAQAVDPQLLSAMRISVFDMGYSNTIAPILAMRQTAVLLSVIGGVCCLVVLILFVYLLISKQKDAARTMISLGTGKLRAWLYILTCVLLIAAAASLLGAFVGSRVSSKVTEAAYARAEQTTTVDNRFSAIYMNNEDVEFKLDFASGFKPFLLTACGITAAALLIAVVMLLLEQTGARKRSFKKSGKTASGTEPIAEIEDRPIKKDVSEEYSIKKGGKSVFSRATFSIELALNSIKRGGAKNLLVPAASLVLAVFIGVFARQIAKSDELIDRAYDSTEVYAYYTSSLGKRVDSLSLRDEDIADVVNDEHVSEVYRSSVRYCQLCGHKSAESNVWDDKFKPEIPEGGFAPSTNITPDYADQQGVVENFALISMLNDLVNYDKVIFTCSIKHSPEFLFENELHINYLDGYSEDSFSSDECICAMPATYMEKLGYSLGDQVSICVFTSDDEYIDTVIHDALIAASFEKAGAKNNIYMPLAFNVYRYYRAYKGVGVYDKGYTMPIDTPKDFLEEFTKYGRYEIIEERFPYSAAALKLTELRTLNEFKDKLIDLGYSPVGSFGKARMWLVVEDTLLNNSIVNINRHVSYMTILFIVVYILAAAIGFVLSYLLTKSRRSELAMMRSMGTGALRTFGIFLLEQLILSIVGGLLGILVIRLIYGEVVMLQWLGFAGYFICYWTGAVISAAVMNKVDVISILGEKEQ